MGIRMSDMFVYDDDGMDDCAVPNIGCEDYLPGTSPQLQANLRIEKIILINDKNSIQKHKAFNTLMDDSLNWKSYNR